MPMRCSKTPSAEFVYNVLQVYSSNPGNSLAFAVPEVIRPPAASDPAMAADAASLLRFMCVSLWIHVCLLVNEVVVGGQTVAVNAMASSGRWKTSPEQSPQSSEL